MAKAEKMIATVLAFEKKLVPSDGYLYGTTWEKRHQTSTPLKLIEKSVRGTISNRFNKKDAETFDKDPMKLNQKVESPNLQKVDTCALGEHQDTLKLHFTLKVLGGLEKPSACNNEAFNKAYAEASKNYIEQDGFKELAKRYAINLANGRYLWRNRVGAEKVEVVITTGSDTWTFNAHDFSLKNFDSSHANMLALAQKIADALSGKLPYLLLNIEAYALVGSAQEVYPSEELVLDKNDSNKNKKSKILYSVNDVASMHSQKIGNALRTIDTWYPEYAETGFPIAIEPYGAVTNLGKAYRNPKEKADFYTLFDRFAVGEKLANKEQEHYVMAVLVRGGVFGQSGKD